MGLRCSQAVLLAILSVTAVQATNPSVTIQLFQRGVDLAKDAAIDQAEAYVRAIRVPNQDGETFATEYHLSNLHMEAFDINKPQSPVALQAPSRVQINIGEATARFGGHYWFRIGWWWAHWTWSGEFYVDLRATAAVGLRMDEAAGKPQLRVLPCCCSGYFQLVRLYLVDGGPDSAEDVVRSKILSYLNNNFCGGRKFVQSAVNENLNTWLRQHVKTKFEIGHNFGLDYGMTGTAKIAASSLVVPMLGRFYLHGHENDPQITQAPPFPPTLSSRMICANFHIASMFGTLVYGAQRADLLHRMVDRAEVNHYHNSTAIMRLLACHCPNSAAPHCFGEWVPEIQAHCGPAGYVGAELRVDPARLPGASMNASGGYVQLGGTIKFFAVQPGKANVDLLTVTADTTGYLRNNIRLNEQEWTLIGQNSFRFIRHSIQLASSDVGPIAHPQELRKAWVLGLEYLVHQMVNKKLLDEPGVRLPKVPHLSFHRPTIEFRDGVLTVCGDLQLTAKAASEVNTTAAQ